MPDAATLYGDESGNTGPDLLDRDQPHFVYSLIEANAAQQGTLREAVEKLRTSLGRGAPKEFKYSKLRTSSPGRRVSIEIARIVSESGARLHLAFVEKRYQLCSMIVETYADSGGPLEQELDLVPGAQRRQLAFALYEVLSEAVLRDFAKAVETDDIAALNAVGDQIRRTLRLHPSREVAALASRLELCASEPFRFGERYEGKPKHTEKPATILHVFFPFMKEVDEDLEKRDVTAELVADQDSIFGPALNEIHRAFSVGGEGRPDWLGRGPLARITKRLESDSLAEPLLQLADAAAGMHCSVFRDAAAGARIKGQQQDSWTAWSPARNRGRHFVWASPRVRALVSPG